MERIRREEEEELTRTFVNSGTRRGDFPLTIQLRQLGIGGWIQCYGLKGLDIGTGEDAKLVEYLRSEGVRAEGIDPDIKGMKII